MNVYRAYPLDDDGRVFRPAHVLDANSDDEAVAQARTFVDGHDIEVWYGDRLITTLRHKPPTK